MAYDSSGPQLAAINDTLGDGSQRVALTGNAAQSAVGMTAKVSAFGALQVSGAVTKLINETCDANFNTTDIWNLSGTQLPVVTSGAGVLSLGATNSVSSAMSSIPLFTPTTQAYLLSAQLSIGAQQTNPNSHRFFGAGLVTTFDAATPLTNGFGWEVDVTGALNAVVYVAGVRYVVNSTNGALTTAPGGWASDMTMSNYGQNLTYPASGTAIVRVDYFNGYAIFYLANSATGFDVPVGIASWKPAVVALPVRLHNITTVAVSTVLATTFTMSSAVLSIIGGTNYQISDPTYPWRQAAVAITKPLSQDGGMVVHQAPSDIFRWSFADAYSGSVDPLFGSVKQIGTGMAVNQTGGNLVITSGTTANSETLIRSLRTFRGALSLRFKSTLSQRIVNNNFIIELADLQGELLAYTINSATSVTVTFPLANPFSSVNVGQFVNLGVITSAAGLPGRFAIASVSGLTVTFTVASWPASGSGTLTLYGWNYLRTLYTGVTATNAAFDTQKRGWNSGDSTLTTLTSASPGHMATIQTDNAFVDWSDSLVASAAAPAFTSRGSRLENITDDNINLYLFIRVLNGTTNPATTTTWTLGLAQIEQTGNSKVYLAGAQNNSANRGVPVLVGNTPAVTVSSGTVTTVTTTGTVTTLANGQTAHSAAATGSPLRIGGKIPPAALDTTLAASDASDLMLELNGAALNKPYSNAAFDWNYSAPPAGLSNSTTPVAVKGAPAASTRNYITSILLSSDALGAATELVIRDVAVAATSQTIASNILTTSTNHGWSIGDSVIASASTVTGLAAGTQYYVLTVPSAVTATFSATPGGSTLAISGTGVTATLNHYLTRVKLSTAGVAVPSMVAFPSPLRGGTALATEIVTLTASITGAVFVGLNGYVSM